jgi:glycosyltransferase 2 family protein
MSPRLPAAWRSRLASLAKVVVSVGLLAWLLHKAGLQSLGNTVAHADWRWLLGALGFGFLATFAQSRQWQALLRAVGMPRTWLRCLRLVYVGMTFNTVLPTSIGGDVVRATMAANDPSERVRGLTSVVLQRLCNFPGMILIMGLGLILTLQDHFAGHVRPVAILGVVCGAGALAVCSTPLLGWLAQRRVLHRVKLDKLFRELHDFRGEGRQLLLASGRGTLFWALSVFNWYCFMRAVGIPVSIELAAVITTTISALTMLPVSINGYGVREGAFIGFLALPGLATPSAAVAASLCLAAQTLVWAVIGVPFVLSRPRAKPAPRPLPALVLSGGRREDPRACLTLEHRQKVTLQRVRERGAAAELTSTEAAR